MSLNFFVTKVGKHIYFLCFVLTIFTATCASVLASERSVELEVNSDHVDSNLVDFPVFVDLADMPTDFWDNVSSDGGDIRVYTDSLVEVPYELSSFNKIQKYGSLFFKAPVLDSLSDSTFVFQYGDAAAAYLPDDPYGSQNVWKESYKAVLHFEEDPSGTMFDSTENGNNAVSVGSMSSADSVTGPFQGSAIKLDGVDDRVSIPHNESLDWEYNDSFSVYGWVKAGSTNFNGVASKFFNQGWMCKGRNNGGFPDSQYMHVRNNSTNEIRRRATFDQGLDDAVWHLVHCTYDGSGFAAGIGLFGDGYIVPMTTDEDNLQSESIKSSASVFVGSYENYVDSSFDELRLIKEELSPAWIKAEYINMSDPQSFYSIELVETGPSTVLEWLELLRETIGNLDIKDNRKHLLLTIVDVVEDGYLTDNLAKTKNALNGLTGQLAGLEKGGAIELASYEEISEIVTAILLLLDQEVTNMEVPLITQVESPYPSLAATAEWANDLYASGSAGDSCGTTIAQCGCALSSMAMIAQTYGVDHAVDGSEVNPGNMNAWLSANNGYTNYGGALWGKVLEYLSVSNGSGLVSNFNLESHNETNGNVIDTFLKTDGPAMAYNANLGHFYVLTDKNPSGAYGVRDPWWYNTLTSDDVKDATNYVQDHNNTISKANLFSYQERPKKLSRMVEVRLGSPAELQLADAKGDIVGYDPATSGVEIEIDGGSYDQADAIFTTGDVTNPHVEKTLLLLNPADDFYRLRVIGTGDGPFSLTVLTIGDDGLSVINTITDVIAEGEEKTYLVDLASESGSLDTLIHEVTLLTADWDTTTRSYILNKLRVLATLVDHGNVVAVDAVMTELLRYVDGVEESEQEAVLALLQAL